ncbi:SEL1-like repeat protein [Pontixanthobacter aquaemixtae]|uniref:Beta-lactamase n=1 Tax=Pontixanthobacter aquaemixtae TaxID=1958940 RepID=A0A844ZRD6_9SPHN|nr:hypothetical protein [Pontixanthobacter aquaemixtae]MXO89576.1 hypothetical protein [Pontixanthobacter aquaemixtae]
MMGRLVSKSLALMCAALIALSGFSASAGAQTIDCKEAYNLIFGALNGSRADGQPAVKRNDVPDGAISWALAYEKRVNSGVTACTPPDGILGAYLGLVQADNRRYASRAANTAPKPGYSTGGTAAAGAETYFQLGETEVLLGNIEKAHAYYTLSCNQGHARACYEATGQFSGGKGGKDGGERALAMLADGCRRTDQRACDSLNTIKAGMSMPGLVNAVRLGVAQKAEARGDRPEAKRVYSGLCDEDNRRACYELARILETNEKSADTAKIKALYRRSCQLGYEKACR